MKYEPVKDPAERKRILALIERCEKEQTMNRQHMATYINALENRIRELETARPQGEWINQHENGHGFWVGTCNQCGKENRVNNYCPNCGAQMKGIDDE